MRLSRIMGYHLATIGSSHFCSVIDIVLGAFRFVVNNRNDPAKTAVTGQLLAQLAPLFIRDDAGKVLEISLFFSPKVIRVRQYRETYQGLHNFFGNGGLIPCQEITAERNY